MEKVRLIGEGEWEGGGGENKKEEKMDGEEGDEGEEADKVTISCFLWGCWSWKRRNSNKANQLMYSKDSNYNIIESFSITKHGDISLSSKQLKRKPPQKNDDGLQYTQFI